MKDSAFAVRDGTESWKAFHQGRVTCLYLNNYKGSSVMGHDVGFAAADVPVRVYD